MKIFHAADVQISEHGDYLQVSFDDPQPVAGEYLLLQRQFESWDGGECYVEDSALSLVGHHKIRCAELARDRFTMLVAKPEAGGIVVTFDLSDSAWADLCRTLKVMIPALVVAGSKGECEQHVPPDHQGQGAPLAGQPRCEARSTDAEIDGHLRRDK